MSQYNYVNIYVDSGGTIISSDIPQITQHSTNTIIRLISEDLEADAVSVSIRQVDNSLLPKKLMLLQPTLLDGDKVWQYRLNQSDTALANSAPSPYKFTISIEKDDDVINLPLISATMVKSFDSAVVIPDASSIDGIADGFNAVSDEILRLDELRGPGITNIQDNGDGTLTIEWEDGTLLTSNLTGPAGPQGIQGIQGPPGADGVSPTLGNNLTQIQGLTGQGYAFRNLDGTWTINTLDADLEAIGALGYTSTAFLKKTGINTWALDTNTYSLSNHLHTGVYQPAGTYVTSISGTSPISVGGTATVPTISLNTVPVGSGGTGAISLTSGAALIGNGTGVINTRTILNRTISFPLGNSTSLVDEGTVQQGLARIYYNKSGVINTHDQERNVTIYPPTFAGTTGTYVRWSELGIPTWDALKVGSTSDRAVVTTTNGELTTREILYSGSATALSDSTKLVTEQGVFNGLVRVNGGDQSRATTIYSATDIGSSGQVLKWPSSGSVPVWGPAVSGSYSAVLLTTLTFGSNQQWNTGSANFSSYQTLLFQFVDPSGGVNHTSTGYFITSELTTASRIRLVVSSATGTVNTISLSPGQNLSTNSDSSLLVTAAGFTAQVGATIKVFGIA